MMFKTYVSADEFMRIALDPANADRRLQRIDGEIVELISSYTASVIAATVTCEVGIFVRQHKLGGMTGADCGYTICGEQYIADGAFVSYQREPEDTTEYYPDVAPDLVIEVLSPPHMGSEDERIKMPHKVVNYLAAGCELWLLDPEAEKLERYLPNQPVRTYCNGDILEGVGVLEGFRLEISAIWPQ
jgi:Uma2 family endonuclease